MNLGLFNMPLHPPGRPHWETYDEDLELMAYVDKLGFSEAWIGEHFTTQWENIPAPDLFIARALGETEQLTMGTGVSLLAFHNPIILAHRIAMLDHLAKGRFFFGIGSGGVPTDSELFSMDRTSGQQRDRMREAINLITSIWASEPGFKYEGQYYNAKLPEARPDVGLSYHMKPYQTPHPPIAVAGSSPDSETLELAGEMGWWPMSTCFLHDSLLASHWTAVEKGAQTANRLVVRDQWRIAREVFVADDSSQAHQLAYNGPIGTSFANYFKPLLGGSPRGLDGLKSNASVLTENIDVDYMKDNFWIVGNPDECTEQIRDLYHTVGGFGTLLIICHDWGKDRPKWLHSLDLMAREVQPNLSDLR